MRVKVRAVIFHDGRLVVARERRHGREHFSLPGGRAKPWESTGAALAREVEEETGLVVAPGRLLYVAEALERYSRHDLNLIFLAEITEPVDGLALELVDPAAPGRQVLPPILDVNARDARDGWQAAPRWLGNIWSRSDAAALGAP